MHNSPGSTWVEMIRVGSRHLQHRGLLLGCHPPSLTPTRNLPSIPHCWLLLDGKQHFSVSVIWDRHPAPAPRWVGPSLPWSLHPLQNTPCQASRHSRTDRRFTHCHQLNPSETLFPCWEDAPFLCNRSAWSCCFLSGLSLTSSEISSDTCSYPWAQDTHSVM